MNNYEILAETLMKRLVEKGILTTSTNKEVIKHTSDFFIEKNLLGEIKESAINPLENPVKPSDFNGKNVIIVNIEKGSINTTGKIGKIRDFNNSTKKYEISFSGGWCGHYTGDQLKLLEISTELNYLLHQFFMAFEEKEYDKENGYGIIGFSNTVMKNKLNLKDIQELIDLNFIALQDHMSTSEKTALKLLPDGENYCHHFFL